jgi:RimJ/RimL family protein N-acetyltransferase
VRLEPFADEHLASLGVLLTDSDSLRFTRIPEPPPPGFAQRWLDGYEAGRRDGTREAFAAFDDEGTFQGLALVPEFDREAGEVELGYIVVPEARGRGVATAMLHALTSWAFEQGALRATLIIGVDNPASARVAERCGYTREGVMRSVHLKAGRRNDAALWSRLPSDPEPVRDERRIEE